MSTTHDPRLREALIALKRLEAQLAARDAHVLVLLAEREHDRQTIHFLECKLASMKSANRRRQRRVAAPP